MGPDSPRRLVALGIDLAADEVRSLLSDAINVEGPVQVGADLVVLLRSAEQLLTHVCMGVAPARLHNLLATATPWLERRCLT